jgi:hypothetical protein
MRRASNASANLSREPIPPQFGGLDSGDGSNGHSLSDEVDDRSVGVISRLSRSSDFVDRIWLQWLWLGDL